jgi:hypothetical protein
LFVTLALACVWLAPSFSGTAAQRLDLAAIVHITSNNLGPTYYHNMTTAQIEQMRHLQFHNKLLHNPGVTMAEQELKIDYQIAGEEHSRRDGVYAWAESIDVQFSYSRMDVYVSSQYPESSCAYKVILDHENQHVAINRKALAKYKVLIEKALKTSRSIPTKAHPLSAVSIQNARNIISSRINAVVNPIVKQFKKEVTRENGKIDTAQNYRRTQAKCKDW